MAADYHSADEPGGRAAAFATTHWSVVLAAGHRESPQAAESLEKLCHTYWYPLYAYIRRRGYSPEDAQDLIQAFFLHVLKRNPLRDLDRAKGKFRSFLLASLGHFLANEYKHDQAQKRGGGCTRIHLDIVAGERRYGLETASHESPDKIFERNWALALMEQVLERLRVEQQLAGKRAQFNRLQDCLMGDPGSPAYADLAAQLGLSEDAVKMAVCRLRHRYRELLREEIGNMVGSPAEIEEEIRHLFRVFAD